MKDIRQSPHGESSQIKEEERSSAHRYLIEVPNHSGDSDFTVKRKLNPFDGKHTCILNFDLFLGQ